ncbi:MAG: hypothetical protein ACM3N7_02005 [Planctomycetaceae bacterium]
MGQIPSYPEADPGQGCTPVLYKEGGMDPALQWVMAVAAAFTAGILVKLIEQVFLRKPGANQGNRKKGRKGVPK